MSITISPIHLLFPVLEATLEVQATKHFGIAAVGGFGSYTPRNSSTSFAVQEIGAQALVYPIEDFSGFTLGGEVDYVHLSGDFTTTSVTGVGAGTAIGPLIGYKLVTKGGFTLVVQGGIQHLSASAKATSTVGGGSQTASETSWLPLLNFNIGWSF